MPDDDPSSALQFHIYLNMLVILFSLCHLYSNLSNLLIDAHNPLFDLSNPYYAVVSLLYFYRAQHLLLIILLPVHYNDFLNFYLSFVSLSL
eukprot:UN29476